MLEKLTFQNDDQTNKFFRDNPGIYLVKLIIAHGEQHLIVTRDQRIIGRDHLQKQR